MKKAIGILGLSVLIFSASGCSIGTKKTEVNAEVDNRTAVYVEVINKTDVHNEMVYSGTVNPSESVNVMAGVTAKVKSINYEVGDHVESGAVLCKLDTSDIENNYNALKASYNAALANAEAARVTYETVNGAAMQMQIANAELNLTNAEIQYNTAKETHEKNKVLYEAGAVSDFALEQSADAVTMAESAYNTAKEAYEMTANVMPGENEDKARAAYEAALSNANSVKAQLASVEKTLNDTNVKAPISGTIASSNLTVGEYAPSTMPAFVIIQTDTMKMSVNVSEQIINKIHNGDEVNIKISAISNDFIKGTINTVSPAASASGTYPIEILLENPGGVLKAGMFGEVYFTTEKSDATISIPRNAVIDKNGEKYVFVEKNGIVSKRIVSTGIDTGDYIEITSGLSENEHVVTKGQTYLSDGDEVLVSNSEEVK